MVNKTVIRILVENDLKVTPQRIAILDIILNLNNHPTAEIIQDYLRLNYPHVPMGTVYKILDVFVEKGIVSLVKTNDGVIRYDPIHTKHHHLYSSRSNQIEDFYDEELNLLLEEYFRKKEIPNFKIEDIRLQIIGRFMNDNQ
jgi:Fur family peroxide stress response transcriptional regulator